MLNRTIAPIFHTIDKVEVMQAGAGKLDNGIPLYSVHAGSQEITRLEFIFKAGMYYQPATMIASCTNSLLENGTKSYTANQISEGIDFFGSFIELGTGQDFAGVTVYSLNKYLPQTLKFVEEVLKCPVFSEEEFRIHIANKKQRHQINSQKVNVLAKRKFTQLLYGQEHPYGRDIADSDFNRINTGEIRDFYNKYYHSSNCTIIASGYLPSDLHETLNSFFGKGQWGNSPTHINTPAFPLNTTTSHQHLFEKQDAIQSALRVGRVLFNKTHEDYFVFQFLNIILGGYFGSRLMANIREDKGYTYGIGSGLTSLVNSGYFCISSEVGADVASKALDEIYKEINILREELVDEEELETVRNYVLGQFLRSIDGPFALADKFRNIWEFGMNYDYYDRYFTAVKNVNPQQIRDMANKYLRREDLIECVVGKK